MSYALAIVSGMLMMLSMPGFDYAALAWFGLVPLLVALGKKTATQQYFLINITCII